MKKYILIIVIIIYSVNIYSNKNYSASFTYKHIQGRTYEFSLILYKDTLNIYPKLTIDIDNNIDTLIKQSKCIINGIAVVKYQGYHTFLTDGHHSAVIEPGNRIGGINNIPNSINRTFALRLELEINPFVGSNNSPNDSIPLIDTAIVNQAFSVNLSSNDIDGDSLSYKLKPCRGSNGYPIPGYTYPAQPPVFALDSISGILTWNTPQYQGNYSVLIQIEEWRSGNLISYTEREHFIVVNLGSGVNNANDKSDGKVDVFPNPSNDIVNIRLKNSKEEIVEIEVFDIIGKQKLIKSSMRASSSIIDVSNYEQGVYFYKIISSNKEVYSGKFIVY